MEACVNARFGDETHNVAFITYIDLAEAGRPRPDVVRLSMISQQGCD